MARYNKIYAGPYTEATPQVQEAILNGAYVPGTFLVWSSGNFAQAGANSLLKLFILQDNYLMMKGVSDAWASGDRGIGMELLDEQFFNALVATGNNLVKGSPLTTNATGRLVLATTGQRIVAFSEETYNNNTGSDQLVRVRPAKAFGAV
ncbi:hypothetical protein FJ981_28025 [Mesorhizobium sp. B1-1-4]|uniref:hypothetical protein n=1 Tax=Mesorhizobium sp. B1-1-4 TaxID=2589980 RepID=UPI00112EF355|nr:hypothetical protein [Mesorhizobium sp. B1-1-4]TPN44446.1 hypothetical protein FJ981_28025 [Mesorhizobium sp. B1-1-4]